MVSQIPNETAPSLGAPKPAVRQGDKLYVSGLSATTTNAKHHFTGKVRARSCSAEGPNSSSPTEALSDSSIPDTEADRCHANLPQQDDTR